MASYALKGFKPQTVPVKLVPPADPRGDSESGIGPGLPTFSPSPVYAELEKAGPERKQAPPPRKPKAKPVASMPPADGTPAPAAQSAPARQPASTAPAPTAASPWPPSPNQPTQVR